MNIKLYKIYAIIILLTCPSSHGWIRFKYVSLIYQKATRWTIQITGKILCKVSELYSNRLTAANIVTRDINTLSRPCIYRTGSIWCVYELQLYLNRRAKCISFPFSQCSEEDICRGIKIWKLYTYRLTQTLYRVHLIHLAMLE